MLSVRLESVNQVSRNAHTRFPRLLDVSFHVVRSELRSVEPARFASPVIVLQSFYVAYDRYMCDIWDAATGQTCRCAVHREAPDTLPGAHV